MPRDLVERGMRWLADKLAAHNSETVVYRRGVASVSVVATVGRTLLSLSDGVGGQRVEWTDADFLIKATDLVISGSAATPARGDRIRRTRSGLVLIYEVMAPASEPPWKWADEFRLVYRIHTKQVGTEVVP